MNTTWHSFLACAQVAHDNAGEPVPAQAVVSHELQLGSWTFVRCELTVGHSDGIISVIGGATRRAHMLHPRSGIGVFFSHESTLNISEEIFGLDNLDIMGMRLRSAIEALRVVEAVVDPQHGGEAVISWLGNDPLCQVMLKTDSRALVEAMTAGILRWRQNGFTNRRGDEIRNAALFRALDERTLRLADSGVTVQFWLVSRGENRMANQRAKSILYEVRLEQPAHCSSLSSNLCIAKISLT
jgi:ribonuclease HI